MAKKARKQILPVFFPQQGCPGACVFCNQRAVTGHLAPLQPEDIKRTIGTGSFDELAYYGGSFLSLPSSTRHLYLELAIELINSGRIRQLRISTRPDSINQETLSELRTFRPAIVELGVESLSDEVLTEARRGHSTSQILQATRDLRQEGHKVGWQLMVGLPTETESDRELTLDGTISIKPDFVRVSPVLVLKGAALEEIWREGHYQPLSLNAALVILSHWVSRLERAGISIARLGLHPTDGLTTPGEVLAGPWHPALGELVRSYIALQQLERLLETATTDYPVIMVPKGRLSLYLGLKKVNEINLKKRFPNLVITEMH